MLFIRICKENIKTVSRPAMQNLAPAFFHKLLKMMTGQLAPELAGPHYLALLIQVKQYCSAFT